LFLKKELPKDSVFSVKKLKMNLKKFRKRLRARLKSKKR